MPAEGRLVECPPPDVTSARLSPADKSPCGPAASSASLRISALALTLLLAAVPGASSADPAAATDCDPSTITIMTGEGKARFAVEIADEPAEQARGLMYRPRLAEDAGMLFVFDPPRQAHFWMRNTMVPLDMIFIDPAGRVESVSVRRDIYSQRTSSSRGIVRAVLEINAGLSGKLGIDAGDQAIHPAFADAPEGARCAP